MNEAGTETYFDKPAVIEALQYWVDLSAKHKVMPAGVIEWGTTPKDFFEKKAAMIWTTTGNLTNIRSQRRASRSASRCCRRRSTRARPTGGGNFYLFAKTTPAEQQAALQVREVGRRRRSAPRSGASPPATSRSRRRPGTRRR